MDTTLIALLIVVLLFLMGLYFAMAARIEVGRLRSRVTEVEDRVRQLLAIQDGKTKQPDRQSEERPG